MEAGLALLLAAAGCLAYAPLARGEDDVTLDQGGDVLDLHAGGGMPSSNPRVEPILAAYPGQFVVICVAGCDGKPKAVQVLPRPVTARVGHFEPSKAKSDDDVYGPPLPKNLPVAPKQESNDVVCVAGCVGRPGQVVQRLTDLPPPKSRSKSKDKRNEPLEAAP